jgi:hypothetical protein
MPSAALIHSTALPELAMPLRNQLEKALLAAANEGATPLSYAYFPGRYRFLTAGAPHLLAGPDLDTFLESVARWAVQRLGTSRASTPQLRIYAAGCERHFARDNTAGEWRYCYSLAKREGAGRMELTDGLQVSRKPRLARLARFGFAPGSLFVHNTRCSYRIRVRGNPEPLDGLVFLDGFLW